jgi:hypothetical protein
MSGDRRFTGIVGLNPIVSNLIAITVCSLLNHAQRGTRVHRSSIEANI